MARTNANATDKPVATEPAAATQPVTQSAEVAGASLPASESAALVTTDADAAPAQAADQTAVVQTSTGATPAATDSSELESGEPEASTTAEVTIYPLRSYLDGAEVRRAGGSGYKSPKHDAVSLIAAGLATDKKPKA